MAPKARKSQPTDPEGIFDGMVVFLLTNGVNTRRLQIWKQKLVQMGATIETTISKRVTHVFTVNSDSFLQQLGALPHFKGNVLLYQWLEDSLIIGEKACEDSYIVKFNPGPIDSSEEFCPKPSNENSSSGYESSHHKRIRNSPEDHRNSSVKNMNKIFDEAASRMPTTSSSFVDLPLPTSPPIDKSVIVDTQNNTVGTSDSSLPYSPPDLNRNITEIFGKLINIYRALGDDRRSFSYSKANAVIEKLPFKIESVEQVKQLPSIGKSMKDHIQEIVTTGTLSKLEHFETDEKVRTISIFGEVWGMGPATALKLYDKGHRTLDDLKNDDSLTNAQRFGLKYFDDIRTRIPRHEVQEMVLLLQKAGECVLPGVVVVCGGSFRRGKASCGDMDIIITHPDGKSHIGFLSKYVKHLKETAFLREDLIFSIHSEEGTDFGVDTYFGLCTYPGRELRHRIDLKVYPMDIYMFGLVHWTGNDVLNRRLRLLADSKGFRLDDKGLFPATQSSGGNRGVRATKSLKFETEKELFDFLGFPWLPPNERNL